MFAFGDSGVAGVARFAVSTPPSRPRQQVLPSPGAFARLLLVDTDDHEAVLSALVAHYVMYHLDERVDQILLAGGITPTSVPNGWMKKQAGILVRQKEKVSVTEQKKQLVAA